MKTLIKRLGVDLVPGGFLTKVGILKTNNQVIQLMNRYNTKELRVRAKHGDNYFILKNEVMNGITELILEMVESKCIGI